MNAPKKIWMDAYSAKYDWNETNSSEDIPYIRADLVDKLVEALEHYCNVLEKINMTAYRGRAALKALETNNE